MATKRRIPTEEELKICKKLANDRSLRLLQVIEIDAFLRLLNEGGYLNKKGKLLATAFDSYYLRA